MIITAHTLHIDPHTAIAIAIAVTLLVVPAMPCMRGLPLTRGVRASAVAFFTFAALNHVALATGWYDTGWALACDIIEFIALVSLLITLNKALTATLRRRAQLAGTRRHHRTEVPLP